MEDWTNLIAPGLARLGLAPTAQAVERLGRYGELLRAGNQVINLTAITQPAQIVSLHFLDSAALLTLAEFQGKRVLDVGTGAGFPGLVLKILEPSLALTLMDATGKKVDWLRSVGAQLGLEGVEYLHARAEEQAMLPGYRDSFDLVTARAVSELRLLAELCLPFVRPGGAFLAMKAADSDGELSAAAHAVEVLAGGPPEVLETAIPGTEIRRRVIRIPRTGATPQGYPRSWAKIKRAPL